MYSEQGPPRKRLKLSGTATLGIILALVGVCVAVATIGRTGWFSGTDAPVTPPTSNPPVAYQVPAPPGTPLAISEQGFTVLDDGNGLTFAFTITNSADAIAGRTQVDVSGLDAAGSPIAGAHWVVYVNDVPSARKMYHGAYVHDKTLRLRNLARLSVSIVDTQLWIHDDHAAESGSDLTPVRRTSPVEFHKQEGEWTRVTFAISNPPTKINMTYIHLVFRDANRKLLGGCDSDNSTVSLKTERVDVYRCRVPDAAVPENTEFTLEPFTLNYQPSSPSN